MVKKLTCQEVLDRLADYLDEDAHAELVAEVDLHAASCEHCRVEVDTLRRTILIYRCDEEVVLPGKLGESLHEALERAYREEKGRVEGES